MATPDQIEEQIKFERDAIKEGIARLSKNTKKLENSSYASASVYGCSSIASILPLITARIEETKDRIRQRKNGATFKEIQEYLTPIDSSIAAAITAKIVFDKVFSPIEKNSLLVKVADAVGQAIEHEAQMQHYERECPGLLASIKKNYWHNTTGTQQKYVIVRTLISRYPDVAQWSKWSSPIKVKLGGWLLECVFETTGWFTKQLRSRGKKKDNYIVPTPDFLAIKDDLIGSAELFSPIAYPMLIEPNDWSTTRPGGYLLNELTRCHDMVRRNGLSIQGQTPTNFLNKLQKVAYCINPFTMDVAEQLLERRTKVGKFIPVVEMPLPPKPVDIATNYDSRKEYRRRAAEAMNKNAEAFKRSCRTRMTLEAAAKFKDRKAFYLPWSLDYRGRAYPIPAFLTVQDTDFGKSLLRFADEAFMTPYAEQWLAFSVATAYGLSKEPMHSRMQWVETNESLITAVATDPIGNLPSWEVAEEPWQFLAAAEEYYHCCIKCDREFTGHIVSCDATCSGLQILSALAKDSSTAKLVNVLPSDRPQDAYKVIAEKAKPHIPVNLQPYMDRKITKKTVMTLPYNSKPFSNRCYIREAFKEKGIEISKEDLTIVVKAVRDAMDLVVPGPMSIMKWIESEVSKAIKRGAKELQWVTPSGFIVTQKLNKKLFETIKLQLLGRVNIRVATKDSDQVDLNHHKNATAPNLIHSLDASLLHLSTLRFDAPISLIHDSVLCRATDMSDLSSIVRETFFQIFSDTPYLESWAAQIGAESVPPIIGDLSPELVINSTYFFC